MIDRLRGTLVKKNVTGVVISVGGVGFAVAIPLSVFERLPETGQEVELITHLNVREDALELYGFSTTEERDLFINLLKVNGVGPKLGIAILSRFEPNELAQVVADSDIRRLTTVSGIGKKTAERLLVDLRDRLKVKTGDSLGATTGEVSITTEAIRALEVLGFSTVNADDAIRRARQQLGLDARLEELVKQALKG